MRCYSLFILHKMFHKSDSLPNGYKTKYRKWLANLNRNLSKNRYFAEDVDAVAIAEGMVDKDIMRTIDVLPMDKSRGFLRHFSRSDSRPNRELFSLLRKHPVP